MDGWTIGAICFFLGILVGQYFQRKGNRLYIFERGRWVWEWEADRQERLAEEAKGKPEPFQLPRH